eukprot:m.70248 g.70248  ORF g.70248 m.70248 type:complete len:1019 (-) comp8633_c0_seq2:357-3413(-)
MWQTILKDRVPMSLESLLRIKCPAFILTSRLTSHTERLLMFLMSKVRREGRLRHQKWFKVLNLAGPRCDTLICDLIRYVVCVYHPPNRVISSDVVPRFLVLDWLLKCVTTSYGAQNAKLAVFLDWFAYTRHSGDIMYVEPGMLLLKHAVANNKTIATTLLEFLCLIATEYLPPQSAEKRLVASSDFVRDGITAAISDAQALGVISSISSIFLSSELDGKLTSRVGSMFGLAHEDMSSSSDDHGSTSASTAAAAAARSSSSSTSSSYTPSASTTASSTRQPLAHQPPPPSRAREDTTQVLQSGGASRHRPPSVPHTHTATHPVNVHSDTPMPPSLVPLFDRAARELEHVSLDDSIGACTAMMDLFDQWSLHAQNDKVDDRRVLGVEFVARVIKPFVAKCVHDDKANMHLDGMMSRPRIMLFQYSYNSGDDFSLNQNFGNVQLWTQEELVRLQDAKAWKYRKFAELLAHMAETMEKLGFYYLVFLQHMAKTVPSRAIECVRAYCAYAAWSTERASTLDASHGAMDNDDGNTDESSLNLKLAQCLLKDLRVGEVEDPESMYQIIGFVYTGFSDAVRHNPDILQCFLSGMDATQLQSLTLQLRSDTFSIVGKGTTASKDLRSHTSRVSLVRMLCQTFKWETFEQVCVWEILKAEQACNYTVLMTIAWYVDVPLSPEAKLGIVPILLALIDHDTFNSHSVPRCAGDLSLLLALVPKLGTSTVNAIMKEAWSGANPQCAHCTGSQPLYAFFDALWTCQRTKKQNPREYHSVVLESGISWLYTLSVEQIKTQPRIPRMVDKKGFQRFTNMASQLQGVDRDLLRTRLESQLMSLNSLNGQTHISAGSKDEHGMLVGFRQIYEEDRSTGPNIVRGAFCRALYNTSESLRPALIESFDLMEQGKKYPDSTPVMIGSYAFTLWEKLLRAKKLAAKSDELPYLQDFSGKVIPLWDFYRIHRSVLDDPVRFNEPGFFSAHVWSVINKKITKKMLVSHSILLTLASIWNVCETTDWPATSVQNNVLIYFNAW